MDVQEAIRILEDVAGIDKENAYYCEAWQTLKAAVLAQQTTNQKSTPLSVCVACTYGPKQCRRFKCGCYLQK